MNTASDLGGKYLFDSVKGEQENDLLVITMTDGSQIVTSYKDAKKLVELVDLIRYFNDKELV
jgi:hypothetical protein